MSVNWTDEQKKAIGQHGTNVLVAAAAGSGKTAVLVERIIRQITDKTNPVDIDSMLVTTFTEAAAQTMRQKLSDAILKQLADAPDDKNLLHQMIGVNRADICTIHSFCLKTIRNNFHLIDIDPEFTIGDANELELLKEQLVAELFEELYEKGDENFLSLTGIYSTQKSDDNLAQILLKMYSFIKSMPFYDSWIEDRLSELAEFNDIDLSLRAKKIKEAAKITVDAHIDMVCEAIDYVRATPSVAGYEDALRDDLDNLNRLNNMLDRDWDSIVIFLNSVEVKSLSGVRGASKEDKAPVTRVRDSLRDKCIKHLRTEIFYAPSDIVYEDMKYEKEVVGALCKLFMQFDEKFSVAKRERNVLDFNDLEHICLEILSVRDSEGNIAPSELALSLREKYSQILIDEYQDSNELQEAIFSLVSNGRNLFMVGDIKQSIYRFRHTNPMLFKHKKDTYTDDGENDIRIIMGKNFRSREAIVNGVNNIFTQITSKTVGEIDYDESERLYFGANYPAPDGENPRIEVNICSSKFENSDDNEISDELKEISGIEWEAHYTARRIMKLIRSGFLVCDSKTGQMRPITYRDIVILFRSPKKCAPVYSEVLRTYGIPVFSDTESGYFMSEEVRLMLSVLCITDNPRQDIRLLAVMRSPIGGFDERELLKIRMADRHSDIYTALTAYSKLEGELAEKCRLFLLRLNIWRDMSKYMKTHELIWEIYQHTNYYIYAGAMNDGEQRLANLVLLYERARLYEQTGFKGLFNFVNYIENMRSSNHSMDSAKILGENQNLVRIMSIHKSKGLEFPVVFVASMDRAFNTQDSKDRVMLHRKLGFGIDVVDTVNRYKYQSLSKIAIKETVRYENLSEELRLIYVAFTRAKELLILSAYASDIRSRVNKWLSASKRAGDTDFIRIHDVASAKGLADMVMPAILRNKCCSDVLEKYGFIHPEESREWQIEDGSDFALSFSDESDLCEKEDECDKKAADNTAKKSYKKFVDDRLCEEYIYQKAADVPSKVSVTELKRISNFELDSAAAGLYTQPIIKMPGFLNESASSLSAAQKGSVMHYVMQNIVLKEDMSEEYIKEQINDFVKKDMLTEEQASVADAEKIAAFFAHPLGKRMLASDNVMREMPFEIELEASEIYRDSSIDEKVLLQGIIDCCFEETDGLVLVDYKTDYVTNSDEAIEQIKKKYAFQLEYYKQAIEKILKKEVKEKKLYLFSLNSVIEY